MSTVSNALQKVVQIVLRKEKTAYCENLNKIMFHSSHGIESKLVSNWGTKHLIY